MPTRRPNNIFNFRRLKWGAPKRLDGLKAIGVKDEPTIVRGGGIGGGTIGLVLAGLAGGFAVVMAALHWF